MGVCVTPALPHVMLKPRPYTGSTPTLRRPIFSLARPDERERVVAFLNLVERNFISGPHDIVSRAEM